MGLPMGLLRELPRELLRELPRGKIVTVLPIMKPQVRVLLGAEGAIL